MKTTQKIKNALAAAALLLGTTVMAVAPSVTNQECTDYVLINTPYTQVLGITEVGIDRRVDVESQANDVYLYVEWDPMFGYYIDRWEDLPLDQGPGM